MFFGANNIILSKMYYLFLFLELIQLFETSTMRTITVCSTALVISLRFKSFDIAVTCMGQTSNKASPVWNKFRIEKIAKILLRKDKDPPILLRQRGGGDAEPTILGPERKTRMNHMDMLSKMNQVPCLLQNIAKLRRSHFTI
jgi:hypothetical protein